MSVELSADEEFLEIAAKTRTRLFMRASVIVSHFSFSRLPSQTRSKYFRVIKQSTRHLQLKKNPVFNAYD